MIDQEMRTAILRLHREGVGRRRIARLVGVSRNSVREIVRSGQSEVPALERSCVLDPHLDHIRELFDVCEGNRIRVVEKLEEKGITVPYTTLTDFCRRHRIGVREKRRAGRYHFKPGQEMQHDTSPHKVTIDGKRRTIQCASLVLCYSRVIFAKGYFRWRRFECKSFLNHAFAYIQGCAEQCMVDNASVVIAEGSGADARVATEMIAFAERFNFTFVAHEPGDANRSGRVERPFHYIEHNFYPGRTFRSFTDLNQQLPYQFRYSLFVHGWFIASRSLLFKLLVRSDDRLRVSGVGCQVSGERSLFLTPACHVDRSQGPVL